MIVALTALIVSSFALAAGAAVCSHVERSLRGLTVPLTRDF